VEMAYCARSGIRAMTFFKAILYYYFR